MISKGTPLIHYDLRDGWTVAPADPSAVPPQIADAGLIPAVVPGSVHIDLLAAGLIPDPYLDDNEALQTWIGRADWTYRRPLQVETGDAQRVDLVFEGLDTVARIVVNGVDVARTRNMHRTYRFDITSLLKPDGNDIEVAFSSPVREADRASVELGYRPHVNHHPYNAIRKMACSFGWDWGIDTSTSGIWRPARIEAWSHARLSAVRVAGVVVDGVPVLRGAIELERSDGTDVHAIVRVAGEEHRVEVSGDLAEIELPVPSASLWWPRGHGEQPLSEIEIELRGPDGTLDTARRRVGFRSVRIETASEPDGGAPFRIVVNDEVILVRGFNWIPDDAFPHRVDRARYADRLSHAEFAGANLIRVWGGGIYESDDFYAECDERGILVWQDFLLACAAYAEEDPLRAEFEAEARDAITRLSSHPSLALFNGNNENLWGYQEWSWRERLDGRSWGGYYYYELFPQLVSQLAPHVGYTPGSPFSPDRDARQNDDVQGSVHNWVVWNQADYTHYRDHQPRFVAEFGWQGPPTWTTLRGALSDDPLTPESPGMIVHQKAMEGNAKLTDGLRPHLPMPDRMEDWVWAMALNQAVAVRTGVEWYRSLTPHCTGTIVWQLNDCWPVTSWAALDGAGRRKPALFALRTAHAERLVTIQPDGQELAVVLVNDQAEPWRGRLWLERRDYGGSVLVSESLEVEVAPRGAVRVPFPAPLQAAGDRAQELLVASLGEARATWFFAEYRDSALEQPRFEVRVESAGAEWLVRVTSPVLVRELTLLVDLVSPDAVVDSGMLTVLPGETATFRVAGAHDIDPARFAEAGVIRCANDLLAPGIRR